MNDQKIKQFSEQNKLNINELGAAIKIKTPSSELFDITFKEDKDSAIDHFILKTKTLEKLFYSGENIYKNPIMINLFLLAYISEVESYFREILRKLILIDKFTKKNVESNEISYGAAITHKKKFLPESLLERCSFADADNIRKNIKSIIGITGKKLSNEIENLLMDFSLVCELRHCIIHRANKFGAKNAIKLGLEEHQEFLEKPIKITTSTMAEILQLCVKLVKVINSYLYNFVLIRTANEADFWKWSYRDDKELFNEYIKIFNSKSVPFNGKIKNSYDIYRNFKTIYEEGKLS